MVSECSGRVGPPGQQEVMLVVEVPGLVPGPDVLLSLYPAELGPVTLCHLEVPDASDATQGRGGLPIIPE